MSDLNRVLTIRARTGRFHGRTATDEQAYFETFSGEPVWFRPELALNRSRAALAGLRSAFGRRPVRHARLT